MLWSRFPWNTLEIFALAVSGNPEVRLAALQERRPWAKAFGGPSAEETTARRLGIADSIRGPAARCGIEPDGDCREPAISDSPLPGWFKIQFPGHSGPALFIQDAGVVPKNRPRRKSASPVTLRWPAMMALIRLAGTRISCERSSCRVRDLPAFP
jgi:hypothetical protein